ncbi:hypothetical protein A2154_00610 [Candidatus Gottesmanbacteria bacterium RBG_16_43_7]|uniref:TrpR like protein, YerC/YecD n=1 Tax=Candidatus Gottesmanbacteria bacterium RBG_16_43_7 TaxID=1798373 RepID=A0A1F5Z899_9BACT|nr:MAG: hypothetical protein A2154_00610 [Candidatus Gottesmanbacteria bacterium RBG_16_43_7]
MTRVSSRYLSRDIEEHLCDILWVYLTHIRDKSELKEFIESLLSSTEQLMLAKRLAIAILLSRGFTFDVIDDKLKVSKATITSVQHQIQSGAPGYKKAIVFLESKLKTEEIGNFIEELLLKLSSPAAVGSLKHQMKSEAGKALYRRRRQRSVM